MLDLPTLRRPIEPWDAVVREVRVELRRVEPDDPLLSYTTPPLRHSCAACWAPQAGWAVVSRGKLQDVTPRGS